MRRCDVHGCSGAHESRGYCGMHYRRFLRHGDPNHTERPAGACEVEGCERKRHAKGYCATHYDRLRRYGDTRVDNAIADQGGWATALDAAPLLAAMERAGIHAKAKADQRALLRARKTNRLQPHVVDRIACTLLGVHPAAIYGDDWWLPEELAA